MKVQAFLIVFLHTTLRKKEPRDLVKLLVCKCVPLHANSLLELSHRYDCFVFLQLDRGDTHSIKLTKQQKKSMGLLLHVLFSNPRILYAPNTTDVNNLIDKVCGHGIGKVMTYYQVKNKGKEVQFTFLVHEKKNIII